MAERVNEGFISKSVQCLRWKMKKWLLDNDIKRHPLLCVTYKNKREICPHPPPSTPSPTQPHPTTPLPPPRKYFFPLSDARKFSPAFCLQHVLACCEKQFVLCFIFRQRRGFICVCVQQHGSCFQTEWRRLGDRLLRVTEMFKRLRRDSRAPDLKDTMDIYALIYDFRPDSCAVRSKIIDQLFQCQASPCEIQLNLFQATTLSARRKWSSRRVLVWVKWVYVQGLLRLSVCGIFSEPIQVSHQAWPEDKLWKTFLKRSLKGRKVSPVVKDRLLGGDSHLNDGL